MDAGVRGETGSEIEALLKYLISRNPPTVHL